MAITNFSTNGDLEGLRSCFQEILKDVGFIVIFEEGWETGFRVIGADRKRASQLTATLMNMFIGYVGRNRIVIELEAWRENGRTVASLTCEPYLDVVDIKSPDKNPVEIERCERLVVFATDKIQERFQQQEPGLG
jgi:hypothetical protein